MKLYLVVAILLQFCAFNICQDIDYDVEDMFTGQPSPGVRCTQTISTADYEYEYEYDYNYDYGGATVETSEGSSSGGDMSGSGSGSGSGGTGVLMPDQGTM